jgi:hypothetical protein
MFAIDFEKHGADPSNGTPQFYYMNRRVPHVRLAVLLTHTEHTTNKQNSQSESSETLTPTESRLCGTKHPSHRNVLHRPQPVSKSYCGPAFGHARRRKPDEGLCKGATCATRHALLASSPALAGHRAARRVLASLPQTAVPKFHTDTVIATLHGSRTW